MIEGENNFETNHIKTKSELDWLNIILNMVPCGIIIWDKKNNSQFLVNKEFLKIFNEVDEADGKTKLLKRGDIKKIDLYRSDVEKLVHEDFPTIKSIEGVNIKNLELILKENGIDKKLIITNSLPIYGRSGDILAAITIISDISEFKQIEKDLIKATKGRKLISRNFNDRMANILNNMVTILNINEKYDDRVRDENVINTNRLNIILLNFVYEILSSYDQVEVEIKEYIELIFSEIQRIYKNKVDLKVYGHTSVTLDMLMNCGLIINDIIDFRFQSFQSNLNIDEVIADRYQSIAIDKKFKMCIHVNSNEGKIHIKISDNGPKVPLWLENQIDKFLKLANQLLEQLSGFIKIDSNKQVTSFDFEFLYLEI